MNTQLSTITESTARSIGIIDAMGWIKHIVGFYELRSFLIEKTKEIIDAIKSATNGLKDLTVIRIRLYETSAKVEILESKLNELIDKVNGLPGSIALEVDSQLAKFESAVRTELKESVDWFEALVQTREAESQKLVSELQATLQKKKR